jgi:NTP pyrophosphatase (non-canonical NTP hydrolase)
MTYYLYHIPGKKIGVTRDLKYRVEEQQGYSESEYDVILSTDDIGIISEAEISLQKAYGYKVDETPYNKLKFNNTNMNINTTEQTTTFPCPISKLKGQLMDNVGMKWETEHGELSITPITIDWIMKNVQTSKYNDQRCYVYNKAFARFYDNNDVHQTTLADLHMRDQYNGKTISGGLSPENQNLRNVSHFDLIRTWANERGLYDGGDPKTQALKLVEEVGETCRAILKEDAPEMIDGIGDCVVVLTNLAELIGTPIEECIARAYDEIKDRKGKMNNGTFKKD